MTFEVAIIGGGPGGYETAIRLNQFGISVVCIEKEKLGGVCLNKGCIPTKALVKSADLYQTMKNAEEYGLENCEFAINYDKLLKRKNDIVDKLVGGIEFLFNKRQIPVIKKNVTKISRNQTELERGNFTIYSDPVGTMSSSSAQTEELCTANHIIIATGSEPKHLPFLPFDNDKVLSSDQILNMKTLPKSLTIIGGGVIGCEFACIFKQLGVEVNIVEYLPEIVSTEDEEISKRLSMSLKKLGIKVYTNTAVHSAVGELSPAPIIQLNLSNRKTITSEKVLVSVGRNPVFDIETVGFEIEKNNSFISINDYCQTSADNIFAIGDVTGKLMLAHTASKQGLLVADYLNHKLNNKDMVLNPIDYTNIPACIFTNPEVASCGLTEKQAKEQYENIKIGKFPYSANGKALTSGSITGFVKTIINADTDEIIGMHIMGYLATELIAQASILIKTKAKVNDVANIVFAHPTISECIMESIEDAHKIAIHLV